MTGRFPGRARISTIAVSMSGRARISSRTRRSGCRSAARGAPPGIFAAYREKAAECGREATPHHLAYMALVGVGRTREEGWRRADQILDYSRTSGIVAPQFANPPGYVTPAMAAQAIKGSGGTPARATRLQTRDGKPINPRTV